MHPMVQFGLRAMRSAAEQFVRIRERIENSHEEHNLDRLLEDAGRNVETLVANQLSRGYPEHGVSGRYIPYREGQGEGADHHWKIEPFHGYSNLSVAGSGFALSLVCLVKGRPEHAVVICPFADTEFLASRGRGAQRNGKRIRVPKTTAIAGSRLAMGLPEMWLRPRHLPTYLTLVQQLGPQIETQIATGSGLLDLAELASGRCDAAFVLGLEEQDKLVGSLLLKEAGALMGTPDGGPSVEIEGQLMAAGPRLYKTMMQQLKPHMV
ncbi:MULTISPECIES: inositol monophosphatase family protein [Halomonadaceae]|jgi:myo-inositol-1(or 4)-monophosphatase|uniref:inositol monophosphatase family protein n=1 Tax=Halomonadaceae TaxID=28256 RepID=UPI001582D105|nr:MULTISPECIES: inositol monophosphatase family protein [Halomonas]MDI4638583.1 inositol monophosphatase [Halomonas sp. BMC7]NUJ59569.1 inositol monophosphatase [Halomonas taeanensis]|tara:strand:- start:3051 stop:3848 length:798 start_codon:yes stop_codon:yes gene_type:complete